MNEEIITRDSQEYKDLHRNLVKAIQSIDILIDTHRPAIGNEVYLTSEEICSIFSISKRSLQNYRDNRQIPYTTIGGKILYPQSAIHKLLDKHYVHLLREVTKIVYFIGNERMLIAHDSNRLRFS